MALKRLLTGFRRDEQGVTAVLYALSAVPLVVVIAAAIDYSRAANFRTGMQRGVDSVAIFLAKQPANLSDAQLQARARPLFDAQVAATGGYVTTSLTAVRSGKSIRVEARGQMQSSFGVILGRPVIDLGVGADVASGNKKIELALVLDNTGSMASQQKMQKLKQASNLLLDKLQAAATTPDDVKVSIVPFDTQVRMPASVVSPAPLWIRFAPTDPATGGARATNWQGCVTDRSQTLNYDVTDAAPTPAVTDSMYLASQCATTSLARILPLTNNFAAMRSTIASMQPSGCTNVTIGAVWGLATLSPSEPMSGAAALGDPDVQKIMVILTDGLNTQNRWTNACSGGGSAFAIDARTSRACDSILNAATPTTRIRTYAIRVIEGNETLLRNCAGNGGSYFNVQDPNDLDRVFQSIADEITRIRLTS